MNVFTIEMEQFLHIAQSESSFLRLAIFFFSLILRILSVNYPTAKAVG
ncbi:hypothetical protein [Helicobacter pylori]|nr:hypothetical protein [Helicobacter pylori]